MFYLTTVLPSDHFDFSALPKSHGEAINRAFCAGSIGGNGFNPDFATPSASEIPYALSTNPFGVSYAGVNERYGFSSGNSFGSTHFSSGSAFETPLLDCINGHSSNPGVLSMLSGDRGSAIDGAIGFEIKAQMRAEGVRFREEEPSIFKSVSGFESRGAYPKFAIPCSSKASVHPLSDCLDGRLHSLPKKFDAIGQSTNHQSKPIDSTPSSQGREATRTLGFTLGAQGSQAPKTSGFSLSAKGSTQSKDGSTQGFTDPGCAKSSGFILDKNSQNAAQSGTYNLGPRVQVTTLSQKPASQPKPKKSSGFHMILPDGEQCSYDHRSGKFLPLSAAHSPVIRYTQAIISGTIESYKDMFGFVVDVVSHPIENFAKPLGQLMADTVIIASAHTIPEELTPGSPGYEEFLKIQAVMRENPGLYQDAVSNMTERLNHIREGVDDFSHADGPERTQTTVKLLGDLVGPAVIVKAAKYVLSAAKLTLASTPSVTMTTRVPKKPTIIVAQKSINRARMGKVKGTVVVGKAPIMATEVPLTRGTAVVVEPSLVPKPLVMDPPLSAKLAVVAESPESVKLTVVVEPPPRVNPAAVVEPHVTQPPLIKQPPAVAKPSASVVAKAPLAKPSATVAEQTFSPKPPRATGTSFLEELAATAEPPLPVKMTVSSEAALSAKPAVFGEFLSSEKPKMSGKSLAPKRPQMTAPVEKPSFLERPAIVRTPRDLIEYPNLFRESKKALIPPSEIKLFSVEELKSSARGYIYVLLQNGEKTELRITSKFTREDLIKDLDSICPFERPLDYRYVKHSDVAENKRVLVAGKVSFIDGKLYKITNESRQYLPKGEHVERSIEDAFVELGFPEARGKFRHFYKVH